MNNRALPQPGQLEMELQQHKQQVILVPNNVNLVHVQGETVSRESRARLATRREATVVERMVSGYEQGYER